MGNVGRFRVLTMIAGSLVCLGVPVVAQEAPENGTTGPLPGSKRAAEIVAHVDDEVILYEDVYRPIRAKLERARKQLPREHYLEIKHKLLADSTRAAVERLVVLTELTQRLPSEQAKAHLYAGYGEQFEKYLLQLAREFKLPGRDAVIERLKEEGNDIRRLRQEFIENLIAQHFLTQLVQQKVPEATREDLSRYYEEHIDSFRTKPGVVWSHIEIPKGSDPAAAKQQTESLRKDLLDGASFAGVARNHSKGPTAPLGGKWSLTSRGSYVEKKVDDALFTIPVGEVSDVIEGSQSFHLVLVDSRSDGSPKPFSEVQDDIRNRLRRDSLKGLREKKLEELMKAHHVESVYDLEKVSRQASQMRRNVK
ncbi:peptidylprolyl isomerase [Planctomycetes bacterium Pan216]|uniref:peptidylprolyl isomerase n=1 Tax=Kolteria novifilia TaxID=2527975 RepID=A0A518B9K8_9BACT|nr:peptidylprolyl isomerase [Planctomycetes bacterium Pan216]